MIYWIGGCSKDAETAAALLDSIQEGYEINYDTEGYEFVVLTDYVAPGVA